MTNTCSIQNLGIDLVWQQTQETVSPVHTFEKLGPRHRFIRVPQRHLTPVRRDTEKGPNACDGMSIRHTGWSRAHRLSLIIQLMITTGCSGGCVWPRERSQSITLGFHLQLSYWLQTCVTRIQLMTATHDWVKPEGQDSEATESACWLINAKKKNTAYTPAADRIFIPSCGMRLVTNTFMTLPTVCIPVWRGSGWRDTRAAKPRVEDGRPHSPPQTATSPDLTSSVRSTRRGGTTGTTGTTPWTARTHAAHQEVLRLTRLRMRGVVAVSKPSGRVWWSVH